MTGRTLDSHVDNVTAQATFEFLPGGFFSQRSKADFVGMPIESLEIIGYDPESGTFTSTVYANMAATPLSYRWELDGDELTFTPEELGATFGVAGAAIGYRVVRILVEKASATSRTTSRPACDVGLTDAYR